MCVLLHTLTRKMSVQSFRIRSTQGNSSNIMECEISLKKPRTNFPMTRTTETYKPMILEQKEGGKGQTGPIVTKAQSTLILESPEGSYMVTKPPVSGAPDCI